MTYKFIIFGRLTGLNEYVYACRSHRQKGAKLKGESQDCCAWHIKSQLRGIKINKPVHIKYSWHERDKRRDKDNIAFAKKFIQDALVECEVLKNDGWKEIRGFSDAFYIDKNNPRIEVEIEVVDSG